jgi:large subunit ribosomal protein L23
MHWRDIIRRPVITEKTNNLLASDYNQYTFVVHAQASKPQIKVAIETAWNVTCGQDPRGQHACETCPALAPGEPFVKPAWKKAVVTLVARRVRLICLRVCNIDQG